MEKDTVTVEIPLAVIVAKYLKLEGQRGIYAVKHLNRDGRDFHTISITDRIIDGETHLAFSMMNGPDHVREVVLSVGDIFTQAAKIKSVLAQLDQGFSLRDDALNHVRGLLGLLQLLAHNPKCPEEFKTAFATNHRVVDALAYLADLKLNPSAALGE